MPARTSTRKAPAFVGVLLALALTAAPALAQVPLDPLDDHSAKRLDRMEQALKEIWWSNRPTPTVSSARSARRSTTCNRR
jgi:hypothetical protein